MRIRRVEIQNFRGIRSLSWEIAADQHFVALIGPGDAAKTTILTAIERALSSSWNVVFHDTDFYDCDLEQPITVRVAVAELPDELLAIDAAGLHLCGLTPAGALVHDPGPQDTACAVIELAVGPDLEPAWTFYRPERTGEPIRVKAALRGKFRSFRIDDHIDAHLRWSRNSALSKMTEEHHGTRRTLLDAQRTAKSAVTQAISPALSEFTDDLRTHLRASGGGSFDQLRPGLDTSLNHAQGNLALFDGEVPLFNFGLGTRRLAGTATQQMAQGGQALLLVDELEYGLEPHRLFHLLTGLRDETSFAQVLTTTHSPTALAHLDASNLVSVRRDDHGRVTATRMTPPHVMQPLLRATPNAFLSRHVIVCEGKTEYGMTLALLARWDREQHDIGAPSSAGLGVVAVDAGGNSKAVTLAQQLHQGGFRVTLFIDSDVAQVNIDADALTAQGVCVARWCAPHNTEQAICAELDAAGLAALISLALQQFCAVDGLDPDDPDDMAEITSLRESLTAQLHNKLPTPVADAFDVASWAAEGVILEAARSAVAAAAGGKSTKKGSKPWFKMIEPASALTRLLLDRGGVEPDGDLARTWGVLRSSVYPATAAAGAEPTPAPEAPADPVATLSPTS